MRGVQSVANDRGFSQEVDLVCGASFHVALSHRLLPAVFLSVERHCDLLLLPGLEMAAVGHNIKHLQTERPTFRQVSTSNPNPLLSGPPPLRSVPVASLLVWLAGSVTT